MRPEKERLATSSKNVIYGGPMSKFLYFQFLKFLLIKMTLVVVRIYLAICQDDCGNNNHRIEILSH